MFSKGFERETLEILVAVIVLSLFFIGAWKVATLWQNQTNADAQSVLDSVIVKYNSIPDGVSTRFSLKGVSDYVLVGWSKNEVGRPEKCYFSSCICMCRILDYSSLWQKITGVNTALEVSSPYSLNKNSFLSGVCQSKGICKEVGVNTVLARSYFTFGEITIGGDMTSLLDTDNTPLLLSESQLSTNPYVMFDVIPFSASGQFGKDHPAFNLIELKMQRNKDSVIIEKVN